MITPPKPVDYGNQLLELADTIPLNVSREELAARGEAGASKFNRFLAYHIPEERSEDGVVNLQKVTPGILGDDDNPDALIKLEMLGFNLGDQEVSRGMKADMRLRVSQGFPISQGVEPLFWLLSAGLDLYNESKNEKSSFTDLVADVDKAFNKQYIEAPGGVINIEFEVVKLKRNNLFDTVFGFLKSDLGKGLVTAFGLPGVAFSAVSAVGNLVDQVQKRTAGVLFSSDGPIQVAVTQRGKSALERDSNILKAPGLSKGVFVLIQSADIHFFKENPALFDLGYKMLYPKDADLDALYSGAEKNPFDAKTFAVFFVDIKPTNLTPQF